MADHITQQVYKMADILSNKKAQDIVILSVKGISSIADYFIIATGTSSTHMNALSDYLEKDFGYNLKHKEGKQQGGWLLLDFRDIVVHIFSNDMRQYYSLERIWNDAEVITIE